MLAPARGLFGFLLTRTAWGRHVYAVGDDKEAARPRRHQRQPGAAERLHHRGGRVRDHGLDSRIGRIDAASPNAWRDNANLDSITAVVIGGTSLFGGRGTVYGTLLGALIVGVFRNGISLAGYDVLYQTLVVGTSSSLRSRSTSGSGRCVSDMSITEQT